MAELVFVVAMVVMGWVAASAMVMRSGPRLRLRVPNGMLFWRLRRRLSCGGQGDLVHHEPSAVEACGCQEPHPRVLPPSRWEPFTWPRLLHYTGSSCPTSAVPRVGVARAAVPVWRVMPIALRAMQVPLRFGPRGYCWSPPQLTLQA